jgi:hypothetical protein
VTDAFICASLLRPNLRLAAYFARRFLTCLMLARKSSELSVRTLPSALAVEPVRPAGDEAQTSGLYRVHDAEESAGSDSRIQDHTRIGGCVRFSTGAAKSRPALRPSEGQATRSLSSKGSRASTLEGGKRAFPLGPGTARLRGERQHGLRLTERREEILVVQLRSKSGQRPLFAVFAFNSGSQ